ncbi:pyridoxal-phosphate dependent enzyme, partial [Streptomyces sp. NPDC002130]|uniref:pyridoxal-phosphate dependent enzyme n=1 Tax=Streptomyces sp. NPDC002130 TaxID=3155568 RepID=UPI00332BF364
SQPVAWNVSFAVTDADATVRAVTEAGGSPRVHTPGELTFSVNTRLLDEVVLVTDDEIRDAMRFAFERLKIVVEPSGATPLAALLTGRAGTLPPRVGVVISGGNIDAGRFAELCGGATP